MRHDLSRPRILFFTDTYPPQVNGVSVVTAVAISGLMQRGWTCGVVSPRYPKPYGSAFAGDARDLAAVDLHLKVPSAPFPPYPDIRLAAPLFGRVWRTVREFHPHLVHSQTEFVVGRMGQIAARHMRIPAVSSYHTDFSRYTESYGVGMLRPLVSGYIRRFHRRSRRVYTPSDHARHDLASLGVQSVEVWGRGVETERFHPGRRSEIVRRQHGFGDAFVFLHVGRLAAEKNVALILDAFGILRGRAPDLDARLVIAGDGPEAPALRRQGGGGDDGGVWFCGNLHRHQELPGLYASADAFVFASETETLGLVVLEAMASGLPVIAAPAGGVADNLRDGQNGLSFPPGSAEAMAEAMYRVASRPALREKLARGARDWAETRSWDAEIDRLDLSYREVIDDALSGGASAGDGLRSAVSSSGVPGELETAHRVR